MRHIQLVVFDLAGTTITDEGTVLRILVEATSEHDLPASSDELNSLMGMNKAEVFGMLALRRYEDDPGRAREIADAALQTFVLHMNQEYDRSLAPTPGAEDCFSFLRARGVRIAIDTGFDAAVLDAVMTRLDWLERLVDVAVCSSDVARGRPAPFMIFRAMEQLDIMDVRAVMKVGDSPADLQEGCNAGCGEVVGVLSGAHNVDTLGPIPHTRLLKSVAEIPALFGDNS